MEQAFLSSVTNLLEAGIEPEMANRFLQARLHINPDKELEEINTQGISVVTRMDKNYPPLLKQLFDPPAVLFYRGTLPDSNRKHLAVVGSRKATSYGTYATEHIIAPLAESGAVIVSGLAYGIDTTAHRTTIEHNGTTLAVLGCGIDQQSIYPSANRALASQIIASGGAIISEFPIGSLPLKQHFPYRNRVIAGLCHGTIVIEATLKSGSLITARAALEAGRDVYAVPGAINTPLSEGPNNLIKMGATPVTCASDIMEIKTIKSKTTSPSLQTYEPRNEQERVVLSFMGAQPIQIDEIARVCILPVEKISSTITLLEMKGIIRHEGGCYYTRVA